MTPKLFCDLDTSAVDAERAAIFVAEFLVWWHQAGSLYYRGHDGGLEIFAHESVKAVGGLGAAKRILRTVDTRQPATR